MSLKISEDVKTVVVVAGLGALGFYVLGRLAVNQVGKAARAVSPTNKENIFNESVNSVGAQITGKEHWSPGWQFYEWFGDGIEVLTSGTK